MNTIPSNHKQPDNGFLSGSWQRWILLLEQRENQIFLALTLLIGALVGLAVVAFILLIERLGIRL